MAALNVSLAAQTLVALERIGFSPGADLLTEGGFRKNLDYNALLAAALPDNRVYLTDIAEASAFGAAMTALAALEGRGGPDPFDGIAERFEIEYKPVAPMRGAGEFEAYRRDWLGLVRDADEAGGAT
jgi:L-fuculokinase